jgi:hypothetical protein
VQRATNKKWKVVAPERCAAVIIIVLLLTYIIDYPVIVRFDFDGWMMGRKNPNQ